MLCLFKKFGFRFGAWIWHIRRAYQTHLHRNTSKCVQAKRLRFLPSAEYHPSPMKAYDGCHVTIQVPVDFGNEKEKALRQTFDEELPGVWLTIQGRESVTKPKITELSISEFAYIQGAKAAKEWVNSSEKAQLQEDPFPVVGWAASRTLRQFLQGHK